ncbi:MAG TPA: hypothetical protein VFE46_03175 [Pirellulales bacterium]|jgi:hypothetical protein|nr:hypothetical protein [Pirellulales bacterium]
MQSESDIPQLRVQRELDSSSGSVQLRYFWDNREIQKVAISGVVAERLAGLTLIQKDLVNALGWIKKASALIDTIAVAGDGTYHQVADREIGNQVKAFFVAALTFYGKAFTEASGRRAQLSKDTLDSEFRATHDDYISYRHNMAAHSGSAKIESAKSFMLLIPVGKNKFGFRIHTNRLQPDFAWSDDIRDQFTSLIEHAIAKVSEQHENLSVRIIDAAAAKGLEFWMRASVKSEAFDVDALVKPKR